jgi:uncharacterized repeat protein (TIGR03837 family)
MNARWDIFCRVVDNYGDAGVAWRLARQLAREHGLDVRLWLDDLRPLARIAPALDAAHRTQTVDGVEVRRAEEAASADPAPVVVEAFGCGLPDAYAEAMARASPPPVWFVLEYLSAEAWVDGAHGLPSPHPRLAISRRFWFPGFTPATGGLLRERGLLRARDAFRADPAARASVLAGLGVPASPSEGLAVSLFCYPNPALPALFDAWADGERPVTCLVPDGVAAGAIDAWTGGNPPRPGRHVVRGHLSLCAIPFLPQDAYDRLLWSCDVNFVRGEDSFVRAQWAARPFVWHAYAQAEGAHRTKLDAFLDRYAAALPPRPASAVRGLCDAWNGMADAGSIGETWLEFAAARPQLEAHGLRWSESLAALPDLTSGLVSAASGRV